MKSVATKEVRRKSPASKAGPAKPRVASPRRAAPAGKAEVRPDPSREQLVREAAYFAYERSGCIEGRELENWLQAEAELLRQFDVEQARDEKASG